MTFTTICSKTNEEVVLSIGEFKTNLDGCNFSMKVSVEPNCSCSMADFDTDCCKLCFMKVIGLLPDESK